MFHIIQAIDAGSDIRGDLGDGVRDVATLANREALDPLERHLVMRYLPYVSQDGSFI
jgi:hypothetical protein